MVYKFKDQYMNMSTFCEIKYSFNGRVCDWSWFQNTDSHFRTNITPRSPPEFTTFHFLSMLIVCNYIFATNCPSYAQWMRRYHLGILNINEAHPAACAMLETRAMSITIL